MPGYKEKERARYQRRRLSVLAQKKIYHTSHREERSRYNKQYGIKNRAEISAKKKIYGKANHAKIAAKNRAWVAANREKMRASLRKHYRNNKWKYIAKDANRRSLKLTNTVDAKECARFFGWLYNQDILTCSYCGAVIQQGKQEVDHIVPVTQNGAHGFNNFSVSCLKCNRSKSDMMLAAWPKCPEKIKALIPYL